MEEVKGRRERRRGGEGWVWRAGTRAGSSAAAGRAQPGVQERLRGIREGWARQGASAGVAASGTAAGSEAEAGPLL